MRNALAESQLTKYFLYIRKSTDDDEKQVLSLEAQLTEAKAFAEREHLPIVQMFEESQTAKVPGRKEFNKMLDAIEEGLPYPVGIIAWHPDRLARNSVDSGRLIYLLDTGKLTTLKFPTFSFENNASGKMMLAMGLNYAKYFSDNLSENVRRGNRAKLRRGEWPGQKPFGFVYDARLRNIVPEPKEAAIVQAVFDEFSTGKYSLDSIAEFAAKRGLTTKSGKQRSKFGISAILTNDRYTGVMRWKGEAYEGKYKSIISPQLFQRVQTVLKGRSKPRKTKVRHAFPFCGLFGCRCGSMFTAQFARGNGGLYRYYRCSRKHGVCSERYVQEHEVKQGIAAKASAIAVPSEWISPMFQWIDAEAKKEAASAETFAEAVRGKLSVVQTKLDRLLEGYLDGAIDPESYKAKKDELVSQKLALKSERDAAGRKRLPLWNEPLREFVKALETAGKIDSEENLKEISDFVQKVGTNRLIAEKNVCFDFQKPFDFTASFLASHKNARSASPLGNVESSEWCA